jgi:hypothetical protein|tara:strand:+ start:122 stop:265 length:144 start_codon:yes stop_codon:yes gene_type:complete
MPKKGRPVGTTKANGYKVSPGRPPKKRNPVVVVSERIVNGFKNLLSR